jgi:hypothetical protein
MEPLLSPALFTPHVATSNCDVLLQAARQASTTMADQHGQHTVKPARSPQHIIAFITQGGAYSTVMLVMVLHCGGSVPLRLLWLTSLQEAAETRTVDRVNTFP